MLSLSSAAIRRGSRVLLRDANLQLHAGQRLGLIGANGSGKSSLFAMLLGELEPDAGEARIPPDAVIAHVAQESPHGEQPAIEYVIDGDAELRALQQAIAAAERDGNDVETANLHEKLDAIDGYTAEARAARLLHGLGFAHDAYRDAVSAFSGGWRMRLNLARALMCRSDVLLLDEPTNHLDLPAILWLERWLLRYQGILIVISHDRDFLDQVCTRMAHIEFEGLHLYTGNYSEFEAQRAASLAQQQAMHAKQQKDIRHLQSYVDRFRYKASKAKQAQSRLKMLERMTVIAPAHVDSPFRFHFLEPKKQPQHLLGLRDAQLGYGDLQVLGDVDLHLTAGERVGLLGVNGAGKSTLVKALASGETLLDGERTLSKDTRIAYFAQHQIDLLTPSQSPLDHLYAIAPDDRESECRTFLGRFGFSGERIFDPVEPFSGGEKARLVLALMIRQQPNLLLLDEPTNHLDLEMRQALSVALIEYSGALVVIAHDRHLLRSVCDELYIVHDGQVERFRHSLDDYPAWLKEQETGAAPLPAADKPTSTNRKARRREQAQRRAELKPLTDAVKRVEKEMSIQRERLREVEAALADNDLYNDASQAEQVRALTQEQSTLQETVNQLEWDWLQASEALEKAEGSLAKSA